MRKIKNITKKVVAGFLVAAMVIAGIVITPAKDVEATAPKDGVGAEVADAVTYVEIGNVIKNDAGTPVLDGYLFGGYCDANKTMMNTSTDAVYAKFVPSYVLSVKAQNYAGTDWSDATDKTTSTVKAKLRLVTALDCNNYSEVGFKLTRPSDGNSATIQVTKVYEKLGVKTGDTVTKYEPYQIFGKEVSSATEKAANYFAVLEYTGLLEQYWDDNIYVRPYWKTLDGTIVTGLPKYVRVDDGIDGFISVAVNLKTAEAIAAGVVNVSYETSLLKFDSWCAGNVFPEDEMAVAEKTSSIKCVGNVKNINNNATADDIYISLRFEVLKDTNNKPLWSAMNEGGLTFGMSEIDFAANDENLTDTNVWNVLY